MHLPRPLVVGDLVGYEFPTANAAWAHAGLVIKVADAAAERAALLARQGLADVKGTQVCILLMISHSYPPKGEMGELIRSPHRQGTKLDKDQDLYVCYNHFDVVVLPGNERRIVSVDGPYLGRMNRAWALYYGRQLTLAQQYRNGRSFNRPARVIFS